MNTINSQMNVTKVNFGSKPAQKAAAKITNYGLNQLYEVLPKQLSKENHLQEVGIKPSVKRNLKMELTKLKGSMALVFSNFVSKF